MFVLYVCPLTSSYIKQILFFYKFTYTNQHYQRHINENFNNHTNICFTYNNNQQQCNIDINTIPKSCVVFNNCTAQLFAPSESAFRLQILPQHLFSACRTLIGAFSKTTIMSKCGCAMHQTMVLEDTFHRCYMKSIIILRLFFHEKCNK